MEPQLRVPASHPEAGKTPLAAAWKAAVALAMLLALSVAVRIPAIHNTPFWIDELWRATLILDPRFWHNYFFSPTVESAITSPVYAVLIRLLGMIRVSPDFLRLSSLVPGILAPALAFVLVRKGGGSVMLSFLAGTFFALNPNFISYSNELKPYMFEVCVHLACLYALLIVLLAPSPAPRDWLACFAILAVAILSTPTTIFVLPATGLSLFVSCWARRDWKSLQICVLGFAILGALVLALYQFIWRHGASDEMLTIWASGFYQPGQSYPGFLASQLAAMWKSALQTHIALPGQTRLAFGALLIALGWMIATRVNRPARDYVLFYAVLLATLCLINALRLWPLGAGRENLFLFGHIIVFLFLMLAQLPISRMAAPIGLLGACLFLAWHARNADGRAQYRELAVRLTELGPPTERSDLVIVDFSHGGAIGKSIDAECPGNRTLIFADGYMSTAMAYYTKFDDRHRRGASLLTGPCVQWVGYGEAYQAPGALADQVKSNLANTPRAWFLYTHSGPPDIAALRQVAGKFGRIARSRDYAGGAGYFELVTSPD